MMLVHTAQVRLRFCIHLSRKIQLFRGIARDSEADIRSSLSSLYILPGSPTYARPSRNWLQYIPEHDIN